MLAAQPRGKLERGPAGAGIGLMAPDVSAQSRPIRVVLAVEAPGVSDRLREVLQIAHGDFELVAATASATSARSFAHGWGACVLVLDLNLRDGVGYSSIRTIRAESPRAEIVVLARQSEAGRICAALRAGATGYVLQERIDETLGCAIRCAADGHGYLTPAPGARGCPRPARSRRAVGSEPRLRGGMRDGADRRSRGTAHRT
jgi:CheY-like chemotaxis protein